MIFVVDKKKKKGRETVLHLAALGGRTAVVDYLVSNQLVDPESTDIV